MPPKHSDYQPLGQDEEGDISAAGPSTSRGPQLRTRRASRPGKIDLSKIDDAFKRWKESVAAKLTRRSFKNDSIRREIVHTVFHPAVAAVATRSEVKTLDHKPPMTKEQYGEMADSVRAAIVDGVHPKLIAKGSSGSYFARAKVEDRVQTVGVFKPKDEEPYGNANPKLTKWLHRQFSFIIPFGRACLIPNLSYISEAAASLLDERLELYIVPRTELVSFASPAFFYPWLIRRAGKRGKPLPDKIGSMQCFMHGFQDASAFLRDHPLPGRSIADTFDDSTHRKGNVGAKRFWSAMRVLCGKTGDEDEIYGDDTAENELLFDSSFERDREGPFHWSPALLQSFREELEKLVILDYLMLNTDRGADNYMLKYCDGEHEKAPVNTAPSRSAMPLMSELKAGNTPLPGSSFNSPSGSRTHVPGNLHPHIHLAAIDNSLSFPHEHPKGWRSYTYGWLYLPVGVIGRPFSEKTRRAILPLLTSKEWWEETTFQLRKLFALDPDFHPKMFARQLAVIKGQAWNIVQSLRHSDEGPLELTRRQKVLVWDDEVELPEDVDPTTPLSGYGPINLSQSIGELPPRPPQTHRLGHRRSLSVGPDSLQPLRRRSSDYPTSTRPVPFVSKSQQINKGLSGVAVLEHMERLDKVEAGMRRLGVAESLEEEEEGEEEEDAGVPGSTHRISRDLVPELEDADVGLGSGQVHSSKVVLAAQTSISEQITSPTSANGQIRWANSLLESVDTLPEEDEEEPKRVVIMERLETVATQPFFSCCTVTRIQTPHRLPRYVSLQTLACYTPFLCQRFIDALLSDAWYDFEHPRQLKRRSRCRASKNSRLDNMMDEVLASSPMHTSHHAASGSSCAQRTRTPPNAAHTSSLYAGSDISEEPLRKKPRVDAIPTPSWLTAILHPTKRARNVSRNKIKVSAFESLPSPPRSVLSHTTKVANPRPLYPEQLAPIMFREEPDVNECLPTHALIPQRYDFEASAVLELDGRPFAPFASPGPAFVAKNPVPAMSTPACAPPAQSLLVPTPFNQTFIPRVPNPHAEYEVATPESFTSSSLIHRPMNHIRVGPSNANILLSSPQVHEDLLCSDKDRYVSVPDTTQAPFYSESKAILFNENDVRTSNREFLFPNKNERPNEHAYDDLYHKRLMQFAATQLDEDVGHQYIYQSSADPERGHGFNDPSLLESSLSSSESSPALEGSTFDAL